MKLNNIEIKELLTLLGFKIQEGEKDVYYKNYSKHNNYVLKVDFENEKIEYGLGIKVGDLTTSNFESSENFVVLECVDRILEKGYQPNKLYLENKWLVGRKEKGKLDILVTDKHDKAYLMIECKTWGEEYEKEKKKMQRDGGQLFSYFQQDKSAQYLCLYASRLHKGKIEFVNDIVKIDQQWRELNNLKEILDHWNKNFKDNGIFEDWAKAYNVEFKALTYNRLKELTGDDSGRIFNQFAEILRHNVVSDKPNAFNKILNLFICKIIDEDRNENEEVFFQWLEDDTHEKLQTRLNDLYKDGMKQFLDIEVTDYTDVQLEDKLYSINEPEVKKQIQEMFQHLRLQKNPEFAFKEVYNEESFYDNAQVVREVVELLQPYQFRYGHKQQFLGDFFELLLSTSIKQEAGQFFTPVPIAKFIISCFPIREFINKKIKNNEADILPYVIDYATGSGHFLTEWMDELQKIINETSTDNIRPTAQKRIRGWKLNEFEWAKEFVYGIEADYRLVKTTKVSLFLNGDGEAVIIRADGLDNFQKSSDFKGKLKESSQDDARDNGQFDILVANPPYSVSAFKNTLEFGKESFELYDRLSEDSSEIECLFIERTKQLLKPGGWAGIILPSSILSNSGIYTAAREIILKYFDIKAIAELGSNTFMATGTNTIILFLERKHNNVWKKIEAAVKNFFDKPKEATVHGIEKAFSKYVTEVFEDLELADYITFVNKKPNTAMRKQEIFSDYETWFDALTEVKQMKDKKAFQEKTKAEQQVELDQLFYEKVFTREQDKMLYFFLTYPQETVLIKVGEKQAEKDFIGYEFSSRRGHEGIKMYRDEHDNMTTKLYDEHNHLNPEKASSYVYQSFLNKKFTIEKTLTENITALKTLELMDFKKIVFEKSISLGVKKKVDFNSRYSLVRLGEKTTLISGQSPNSIFYNKKGDGLPFYQGKTEFGEKFLSQPVIWTKRTTKEAIKNDILMSVRAPVGPVNINPFEKICIGRGLSALRVGNDLLNDYLFYLLKYNQEIISGNEGAIFQSISRHQIEAIRIPLPPKAIQEKIIVEISAIEQKEKIGLKKVEKLRQDIGNVLNKISGNLTKLKVITTKIGSGATPKGGNSVYHTSGISLIRSQNVYDFGFVEKGLVFINEKQAKKLDNVTVEKNDVLFNITGASIARCCIVEDKYLPARVNQHVSIIRVNERALPKYVQMILVSPEYKNQLLQLGEGATSRQAITKQQLEEFKIPLPPIGEQKIIVSRTLNFEREISAIESDLANADAQKEAILKKYLE